MIEIATLLIKLLNYSMRIIAKLYEKRANNNSRNDEAV
jgi:hypothetical protein